jgi:hypothetical protein
MVYKFKDNASFGAPAQVVGECVEEIRKRNHGKVPVREYVDMARPRDSPIHNTLTWVDTVAAEKWRLQEAGAVIAAIVVVVNEEAPTTSRAPLYIGVGTAGTGSTYMRTIDAMSDQDIRRQIMARELATLRGMQRRLASYQEFARIWEAVEAVEIELGLADPVAVG